MNVDELVTIRHQTGSSTVLVRGDKIETYDIGCDADAMCKRLRSALRDILPRWVPVGEREWEDGKWYVVMYGEQWIVERRDGKWGVGEPWKITYVLDGVPEVPE